jgi:glutamate synthase domain-containing protein 3
VKDIVINNPDKVVIVINTCIMYQHRNTAQCHTKTVKDIVTKHFTNLNAKTAQGHLEAWKTLSQNKCKMKYSVINSVADTF